MAKDISWVFLRRAASITVPWVARLPTGGVRTANLCLCSTNRWSPLPSIILWDCRRRRRRDCTGSCLPHMLLPLLPWKCSMIQWFVLCIYPCISMSARVHFTISHLTRENEKYSCVDAHANLRIHALAMHLHDQDKQGIHCHVMGLFTTVLS